MWLVLRLSLLLILTGAGTTQAAVDDDAEIVQALSNFGFRGVWAPDCYRTMKQDNPRIKVDITHPGLISIRTYTQSVSVDDEYAKVIKADIVVPDKIVLQLELYTYDQSVRDGYVVFGRNDTYQKMGSRMRLMRSEAVLGNPKSPKADTRLEVIVDRGMSPAILNASSYRLTPILERCAE